MMNEYSYKEERLAYAKGYNIGFWIGLSTGVLLTFAGGLLIGRYVPL